MKVKIVFHMMILFFVLACGISNIHAQVPVNYASFLGGSGNDSAQAVAVAPDGCIWVCGYTLSADFPLVNSIDSTLGGSQDGFVSKFSPDGRNLLFSTYLGGSDADLAMGIDVDADGNAYICGRTDSADFPTLNAFQPTRNGFWTDMFICKLDAAGAMVYSSYLGGSMFDYAYKIAVDAAGCAYVAGKAWSTDFPTVNAFQPANACASGYNFTLTKVAADGASLVYSTYLGGSGTGHDYPCVAVTPGGIAYFGGATTSTDYPVTANAYQPAHAGPSPNSWDGVISVFSADGSSLTYSTFLGGPEDIDQITDIAIGDDGAITVVGITQSNDFPVINAIQSAISVQPDCFMSRLAPDAGPPAGYTLDLSTYLGGWDWDYGQGVAIDQDGSVVAVGVTVSPNFPVFEAYQSARPGGYDCAVSRFSPDGSTFVYSTYLGGSGDEFGYRVALDAGGNAIVIGRTSSDNFPTVNPFQSARGGGEDGFVVRLAKTPYCDAGGGCTEYISRVQFNTIDNASNCDGYYDFTGLSTEIEQGAGQAITVTNGAAYPGDLCDVWVDWNQNGSFADAGEVTTLGGGPDVFTGTITAPANALPGETIMRIRMRQGGSVDPCGNFANGEVEDYTVTVVAVYTVTYDANGADSGTAPADQTKIHDVDLTLATNTGSLAQTGYTFSGWNTAANGSGTHYDEGATYTANAALALYAQWTTNTYTVTYDANGADSGTAPADQIKTHGIDLTLAANSGGLARTAYIFDGWNTAADGLGTDYAEGATYTANAAVTLYAKWTHELDFGDAPDPTYPTLLVNDGARHIIVPGYHLGAGIDAELDGQPSADALGDDNNGNDDEDGVVFGPDLVPCQQVAVTITASGNGLIDAWIDFNADGDWSDAGEQIFTSQAVNNGANALSFPSPCGAVIGQTVARFRFSSAGGLAHTGLAADGEVEDYLIEILADADGDGEPDMTDGCPADPLKTAPGVCGCGVADTDTDGDGTPNCIDGCPYDPAKTSPGLNGCGVSDTIDSDGDGVTDDIDGCPNDPAKVNPGVCGCGVSDVDTDGDGTPDCNDACPDDPAKTDPGVCGCGVSDSDADNDGVPDCIDDTPDEVWNDYNDDDAPFCEFIPVAVLPLDGAAEISPSPDLVIDEDIDPTACGDIYQTRWQISRQPDFQALTYNRDTLFEDPFSHRIAPGILEPETTYYWRARVWCGQGCKSRYSETVSFTTAPDPNDGGQTGGQVTHSLGVYAVVGNQYVSIETTGNITFLQALDNNDQEILAGMPDNMPWGLINFRIEITTPGDTVQVTIYFEEPAPDGAVFYKYDPVAGWIDYSDHAVFAADRKSVTIDIQDGGFGDIDGVANGVIVDPCGIGKNSSGGGSGGCFLDTVKNTQ